MKKYIHPTIQHLQYSTADIITASDSKKIRIADGYVPDAVGVSDYVDF